MKTIDTIKRKRVIIEAEYTELPTRKQGLEFLADFSEKIGMTIVHGPFAGEWAHQTMPDKYGAWEAYAIWAESGVHIYVWEKAPLITFEIFTCKDFDMTIAEEVIRKHFKISRLEAVDIPAPLS
jgi:S-adenosylmethionine decarboxylase